MLFIVIGVENSDNVAGDLAVAPLETLTSLGVPKFQGLAIASYPQDSDRNLLVNKCGRGKITRPEAP